MFLKSFQKVQQSNFELVLIFIQFSATPVQCVCEGSRDLCSNIFLLAIMPDGTREEGLKRTGGGGGEGAEDIINLIIVEDHVRRRGNRG
jgi:hypothetical protein